MRRKTVGPNSKDKIAENGMSKKESEYNAGRGGGLTQTADKRKNLISEPHRRLSNIPSVPAVSQKKQKIQRSDEKKYKEFKLMYNIKKLQKSQGFMIPRAPFRKVIRQIARDVSEAEFKWQPSALDALQYSAEDFMTDFFSDSFACTEHAKRVTLMSKDLALARRIRGNRDPSNW